MTKWESFAAKKGIKSKKKTLRKFDDNKGEYVASWGYKAKDSMSDWCIEVPTKYHNESKDMYEIQSEISREKKSKIVKKQEKNNERSDPKSTIERKYLNSKVSTASLGKYDQRLKNEIKTRRSKQSFNTNISKNPNSEVESGLLIAKKILEK